jgi:hypothetical protein
MNIKNLFIATLIAATGLGLGGCTDTEVGIGVGAVIGGVIGSELGHGSRHEGRGDYDRPGRRCDRRGCWNTQAQLNLQGITEISPVATVADKYQISTAAAQTIVTALSKAQEQDFSGLQELGFETSDFEAIYRGENPSYYTLMTMSERLRMDAGSTNNLLQAMKEDIQAERTRLQLK